MYLYWFEVLTLNQYQYLFDMIGIQIGFILIFLCNVLQVSVRSIYTHFGIGLIKNLNQIIIGLI